MAGSILNGGIFTRLVSEVIGFGTTIGSDGGFLARVGPAIRRVLTSPDGVISDYGGSLALDPQNGRVYVNASTGNAQGTTWTVLGGGALSPVGTLIYQTAPTQVITGASDAFTPTTTLHRFSTTGNYSLSATPTIVWPGAVTGQVVILMNVGATFHVTLNRGVAQGLSLSNSGPRIDPGGTMTLVFDGAMWAEMSHIQATST